MGNRWYVYRRESGHYKWGTGGVFNHRRESGQVASGERVG